MTTDPSLPEGLLNPKAYPHACGEIRLLETHLSWVILTGDYAYKIKKPVQFRFADFSTAELRQHFCNEELRLNRRLSSSLYLDVVPITKEGDQLVVCGDGDIIDYAVRMRQFPNGSLLSDVIETTSVPDAAIDELATQLARFHEQLPATPVGKDWGEPTRISADARENFAELDNVLHEPWRRASHELLLRVDEQFELLTETFAARKRLGMVRECHGDLHLGNMFLEDGRITVFDGIEFNDDFRWIDVINEVAFTVMDFEDRGRAAAGWRFLNAWLEITGDYAGISVLPFYICYRAMVRAKVAAFQARNMAPHAHRMQMLASEFDDYLDLASRYCTPDRAAIMITCGVSGSGKSYHTQNVLSDLRAVRIRSDVERKRIAAESRQMSDGATSRAELYTDQMTNTTYGQLAKMADLVLQAGLPAIVDATFLSKSHRELFRSLAERRKVPFVILSCDAAPELLRQRISERMRKGTDASDATLEVLDQQLKAREPLTAQEQDLEVVCRADSDIVSEIQSQCQRQTERLRS